MNVGISPLKISAFVLAAALAAGGSTGIALAQDGAKQDMKDSGHETKNAAVDAGHGVKRGTRKAYHKTKRGAKKTGHKIKKTFDPHANSQDAQHQ